MDVRVGGGWGRAPATLCVKDRKRVELRAEGSGPHVFGEAVQDR